MPRECRATTRDGAPCRGVPLASGYCHWHDENTADARREAAARGGRNRRAQAAPLADALDGLDLRTADGLAGALAAGIARLGALPFSVPVANSLALLVNAARATLETATLETRIAALEKRATLRAS